MASAPQRRWAQRPAMLRASASSAGAVAEIGGGPGDSGAGGASGAEAEVNGVASTVGAAFATVEASPCCFSLAAGPWTNVTARGSNDGGGASGGRPRVNPGGGERSNLDIPREAGAGGCGFKAPMGAKSTSEPAGFVAVGERSIGVTRSGRDRSVSRPCRTAGASRNSQQQRPNRIPSHAANRHRSVRAFAPPRNRPAGKCFVQRPPFRRSRGRLAEDVGFNPDFLHFAI